MESSKNLGSRLSALLAAVIFTVAPAPAQPAEADIVVIMGDDIGMWNICAYHRGLMSGRTPNLDKLAARHHLHR